MTIREKTVALIDALKATCTTYGMGNDGNEYKIITQVFLYKFLNDKFGYALKTSKSPYAAKIREAEKWEVAYSQLTDMERMMLWASLSPDLPRLKPEHLIANLWNQQAKGDFDFIFDNTMSDIAEQNLAIFSTQTTQNTKIPLFEPITQYVTDVAQRAPFARAMVDKLANFSFEEAFAEHYDFFANIFEYLIKDYNTAVGVGIVVIIIERTILGIAQAGSGVAVAKQSRIGEDGIYLVILVDIEVAREYNRGVASYFTNLTHHKFCTLTTCHNADMVHVEVEVEELQVRTLVLKFSPSTYSDASGIPSEIGSSGVLRQPELAVIQQLDIVFLIENGGILTLTLAVITTYTYVVVAVERCKHILQLRIEHLLSAEHIGLFEVDDAADTWTTLLPAVSVFSIRIVLVAYIVRTDKKVLGIQPHCCHDKQQRHNDLFHFLFLGLL